MMIDLASSVSCDGSRSNIESNAFPPRLLPQIEVFRARSAYTGPDWKHLLIVPEDVINVYAYVSDGVAIGFNTRTHLGGQFPLDIGEKIEQHPHLKPEILVCTNGSYDVSSPTHLRYKEGQYVRICKREEDRSSGWAYGFNQSTLSMGRFDTRYCFDKVEWHGEN